MTMKEENKISESARRTEAERKALSLRSSKTTGKKVVIEEEVAGIKFRGVYWTPNGDCTYFLERGFVNGKRTDNDTFNAMMKEVSLDWRV